MATLQVNGAELEFAERGDGEPVVFVHGSASDYRTWRGQQEEFAKHYRVLAYSRRFHWPNKPIENGVDYSMRQQLEDLASVLRALSEPVHLVGHSYGAFLALLLAAEHADLVRTLVLAEPPVITLFVSNAPRRIELLRLLFHRPRTAAAIVKFGATGIAPASAAAKRGDMDAAMARFGQAVLGSEAFRQLSNERLEVVRANAIRAELLGSGFLPLTSNQIRGVRAPALLVSGARSPALFHRLTEALAELLPTCERAVIEGASHIMHEDNPVTYNRKVMAYLSRATAPNSDLRFRPEADVTIHDNPGGGKT